MSCLYHEIQIIFFNKLKEFLITEQLSESSLDKMNLKNLNVTNWKILFPEGLSQLVLNFDKWQSDQMILKLNQVPSQPNSVTEKISLALNIKITQLIDKEVALKQYAFFCTNQFIALEAAFYCCDAIWRNINQVPTYNFSFYSKRLSLLIIYTLSNFFYFSDQSENCKDTEQFIQSALKNFVSVMRIKELISNKFNIQDIPILRYIFK